MSFGQCADQEEIMRLIIWWIFATFVIVSVYQRYVPSSGPQEANGMTVDSLNSFLDQ